jgi:hypothetical protein
MGRVLFLYDHLSHSLSTQCFAALELLTLDARKSVEDGGDEEEDGSGDERCLSESQ